MFALLNLIESSDMWSVVPNVQTLISLIAFALAVVLGVMLAWLKSKRRKIPNAFWLVLTLLVLVGLVSLIYKPSEIYRVHVTVVDPQGVPVVDPLGRPPEDLKVWANISASAQPMPGGWQFDITSSIKPADGKLTVRASKENAFLIGKTDLTLGNDYNPAITINLKRDDSAKVRGQVVDRKNHAINGARVFVVGYEAEAIVTKEGGNFELLAHAALNQQVLLHAEKKGYQAAKLWHPAGDAPAVLTLGR